VLRNNRNFEREIYREWEKSWGGHLAVTKLDSRKGHGHQRKTSSWSLTFKNMDQGIGEQFLLIQVIFYLLLFFFSLYLVFCFVFGVGFIIKVV
jgi:hypothetical protein